MYETEIYEEEIRQEEINDEDVYESGEDENVTKFRQLLMQENINIIAKFKTYKDKDFRRKLVLNQQKELKKLSQLSKIWVSVPFVEQSFGSSVITVDSSKAGSNIDALRLAVTDLGWKEYPQGRSPKSCHVVWNSCNFNDNKNYFGAYVNKFPGISECLHKVAFSRIIETMRILFPDQYNFYPLTWYLPHQISEFTMYCKNKELEQKEDKYYIVKPDMGTQGGGIYLIRNPQDYKSSSKNHVVQEYLANPLLLDGYKFDLRIYVVLLSLDPLKVYLCNEGLARFCTHKYFLPTIVNHGNSFMHLTNYSLNKKSNDFIHTQSVNTGSKRTMSSVMVSLESNGYNVSDMWHKLEELVYKTMLAIVPQLKVHYVTELLVKSDISGNKPEANNIEDYPNCFQILGFDVLIMEDLQPFLLEVNSNPSLRLDCEMEIAPGICEYYLSKVDISIKKPLVKDTLQLLEKEICERFNIEMRNQEVSNCNLRSTDTFHVIKDNCEKVNIVYTSDKENVEGSDNEWNLNDDYGPYFVEIARINNTLSKDFRESRSNSLNEVSDSKNTLVFHQNSNVNVNVTCPSSHKHNTPMNKEQELLAKEKSSMNIHGKFDQEKIIEKTSIHLKPKADFKMDMEPENDCCLNLISPDSYNTTYDELKILEETTVIFFYAMDYRYTENMSAAVFRNFGKYCRLDQLGFNYAMIDLIYIEIQKRWSYLSSYEIKGLCYQGFLDAFFKIAFVRFFDKSKKSAVQSLIKHCKRSIGPEHFNWTKTLSPSNDPEKYYLRNMKYHPLINQVIPLKDNNSPTLMRIQPSKFAIKKPTKYELMKTIQKIYSQKLKTKKSWIEKDDSQSDSESAQSSLSFIHINHHNKLSVIHTDKPLLNFEKIEKSDISNNNKDTILKKYRYEIPLEQSTKRKQYILPKNFTNMGKQTNSNNLTLVKNSDHKPLNIKRISEKSEISAPRTFINNQKTSNSTIETFHTTNIKNNIKHLSPINNEKLMRIISVYGGDDLLKLTPSESRKRHGALKPF